MYQNLGKAVLSLFSGIFQHPSEGSLPYSAKGTDVFMTDSDIHPIPYIYLSATLLLFVLALVIIIKK